MIIVIVTKERNPRTGRMEEIVSHGVDADTGKTVILVDADLRRPVQHKIFEVSNNIGLTTAVLDSESAIKQHIQDTEIPYLRIMTSGPIPPNPAELLSSHRMAQMMQELQDAAEVVILDTPPVLTVADASILGALVSGCLLVVDTGKTKRNTLIGAAERLQHTGGNVFGAILNKLNPDRRGYGYYYYYTAYEYNAQSKKRRTKSNSSTRWPNWLTGLTRR